MATPHGEHTQALVDVLAHWRKEREALRAEWAEKRAKIVEGMLSYADRNKTSDGGNN